MNGIYLFVKDIVSAWNMEMQQFTAEQITVTYMLKPLHGGTDPTVPRIDNEYPTQMERVGDETGGVGEQGELTWLGN